MQVKIIDFNAAVKYTPGKPIYGKTGEPQFSAPEVTGGGTYHRNVDIWSLGVCLYFMLTKG